ncbi:acyltransferase family protein [Microbacterium luticocti]|uniref:acyltransferase family protein n=1 Tax=Microbacterium luticocti TaxID=451764 RepID=UPI000684B53E|nr:acyltransferase family protein [Microbacterium luticocti]
MTVSEKPDFVVRTSRTGDGSISDPAATSRPTPVRADIQALRALAVLLVVIYHFFPGRVPGGFVGVDVFFVISGFLITSHLVTKPPRSGRQLAEFWGRRIRRLLPASFLVLAVTLVATVLWSPQTVWTNVAKQVAAAAAYIENWFLAGQAVDYLAADDAPSPVQHFWSLSVEEQFYLVWPIVVLFAIWFIRRRTRNADRVAVGSAIAVIVAVSLVASIWITATDPASAYFVSWTRAWELGLGGLAACVFPWVQRRLDGHRPARLVIAYGGLAMIAIAALSFTGAMPFPSYTAALPVAGTALVILAAIERGPLSPLRAMSWKPVQLVGDVSYSMYLWHWPALVLLPYALGHDPHRTAKVLAIVGAFALAWLTKVFIEDRFRGRKPLGQPLRRSFIFAVSGMVVIGLASAAVVATVNAQSAAAQAKLDHALNDPDSCFGSRALVNSDSCSPHGEKLLTSPVFAKEDKPAPYKDGCWIVGDFSDLKTCHYGSNDPHAKQIALIGNSHAGHWLPALEEIAKTEDWSITTYLISECYTVDVLVDYGTPERSQNCLDWNKNVIAEVPKKGYDLVVFSNRTWEKMPGKTREQTWAAAGEAYKRILTDWTNAGTPVLVLHDTPYATELKNVPDCVGAHLDDLSDCDGTRAREQVDPLADVAATMSRPNLKMLDLTDRICAGNTCYSVLGGVIVYFDRGHLSGTFVRSLTADIKRAADQLVRTPDH